MRSTKQRGSGWVIRLALWFYGLFGYYAFFALLYPITFVYFIKASNVRRALKLYYKHIGVKFTQRRYFEHLRKFAIVMTDRFISKCDPSIYKVTVDKERGCELIEQGAVMVLSHFGGWSVASDFLKDTDIKINVIMKEVIKSDIRAVEEGLQNLPSNVNVVDLSQISTLDSSIIIAEALMNKEVVAMMGDRANNPKHSIRTKFFGESAEFNKTPFEIAKKSNLPLMIFFIRYEKPLVYKVDFFMIDTSQSVKQMVAQYAALYEEMVRLSPDQWFNLYDFWEENSPK